MTVQNTTEVTSGYDLELNGFSLELSLNYFHNDKWFPLNYSGGDNWCSSIAPDLKVYLKLKPLEDYYGYDLSVRSQFETQIRLKLSLINETDLFHLIPCNIHGDNNFSKVRPGEFPLLTKERPEDIECSPFWEFRADRSSHPVSMLCCNNGTVAVSIAPYTQDGQGQLIRNGVFSELPNTFGVSLGYTNDPITYINHMFGPDDKIDWAPSTFSRAKVMKTSGKIYARKGSGRLEAHQIIREIYDDYRETPKPQKTCRQAAQGLLDALLTVNWSDQMQGYTNADCKVPDNSELKPWRPLVEIGWTGGGVIAYPLLTAQNALNLPKSIFDGRKGPSLIMDEIVAGYNPKSGMLNDVTQPWSDLWPDSLVNGWWSGFHLVEDCHSAYTNGSAVFYLFKMLEFQTEQGLQTNPLWQETGLKVLDTVTELQREDGAYGYTYSQHEKKVLDWDGFAGCWFAAACAIAYRLTHEPRYLESADRALQYYASFVAQLNCWGTPMDTYKAVDEEGNLAFIRTARFMH